MPPTWLGAWDHPHTRSRCYLTWPLWSSASWSLREPERFQPFQAWSEQADGAWPTLQAAGSQEQMVCPLSVILCPTSSSHCLVIGFVSFLPPIFRTRPVVIQLSTAATQPNSYSMENTTFIEVFLIKHCVKNYIIKHFLLFNSLLNTIYNFADANNRGFAQQRKQLMAVSGLVGRAVSRLIMSCSTDIRTQFWRRALQRGTRMGLLCFLCVCVYRNCMSLTWLKPGHGPHSRVFSPCICCVVDSCFCTGLLTTGV